METKVVNYKDYVINTESGVESGIFFRSPIQRIEYDAYDYDCEQSAWRYLHLLENPIRKLFEIALGNLCVVKHIEKWADECDWGGVTVNKLCIPIYFKREYRKLHAISQGDNNIKEIFSYGYESPFELCAGGCDKELTKIIFKSGKSIKIKKVSSYNYTYEHIIKEIIDSGNVSEICK